MSEYSFHSSFYRVVGAFGLLFSISWFFLNAVAVAENTNPGPEQAIVFIDPGHGGHDTGARGASGLNEKDVTLALGRLIDKSLSADYITRLSRNDDYQVDIYRRTELANNQKASLFVSLHTGGSFRYAAGGVLVYYFSDAPGRLIPDEPSPDQPFGLGSNRVPWHGVQYRHTSESRLLARSIQTTLAGAVGSANTRTKGAPLLALSAANMPAVLIEIGSLNNPVEETTLGDPNHLSSLAEAIARGINSYLNKTSGITSIDLHE